MLKHTFSFSVNRSSIQVDISDDPQFFGEYWSDFQNGRLEPSLFSFLGSALKSGDTFVDIGAWVGCMSIFAASLGCRVIAYEADPKAHAHLARNVSLNHNLEIKAHHAFVGARKGIARVSSHHHGNNGGSTGVIDLGGDSWEVPKISFVSLFDTLDHQSVLVKVDVEGAEYELLGKIPWSISSRRNLTLVVALHPHVISQSINGRSLLAKLRRRLRLIACHVQLFRQLSRFRIIEDLGGTSVHFSSLIWSLLWSGDIPLKNRDIVLRNV